MGSLLSQGTRRASAPAGRVGGAARSHWTGAGRSPPEARRRLGNCGPAARRRSPAPSPGKGHLELGKGQRTPGLGQALPGLFAGGFPGAGVEAVVPDGLIAGWWHMLEVAAQKFLRRQGLGLGPLPRAGLRMVGAPAKANTLLFALVLTFLHPALAQRGRFQVGQLRGRELGVRHEPFGVERPAGHIPGLIAQHVERRRAALLRRRRNEHRPLLPVDPIEAIQPAADGRLLEQREGAGGQQRPKSLAEPRAESHYERPDRHQTAWTRPIPPLALRSDAAARDQAVQMGMQAQAVVPGLERDGEARLRPQALRLRQQPPQGVDGAVEQQVPHRLRIQPPELVERMRQGEDDVKMAHRQQRPELSNQPAAANPSGAARTEAMPAGVVKDALDVAVRTAFHMPAQRGGMTVQRHPHRPADMLLQRLGAFEGRILGPEDLDQAIRRGRHDLGVRCRAAGEAIEGVWEAGKRGTGLKGVESESDRTRQGRRVI